MTEEYIPILPIKFKKVLPEAQVPQYRSDGAVCMDILAAENVSLLPNERRMVRTGLVVELPLMFGMLLFGRNDLGNCVCVVDPDYRNEVKILTYNESDDMMHIKIGDRIAQALVLPLLRVAFVEESIDVEIIDRGDSFVTGTPSIIQR